MAWRPRRISTIVKITLIVAIFGSCLITIFIGSSSLPKLQNSDQNQPAAVHGQADDKGQRVHERQHQKLGVVHQGQRVAEAQPHKLVDEVQNVQVVDEHRHRLAVIVPFRDRLEELLIFAPFIHRYLNSKNILHDIIVVNQGDQYRFNRASLINIGFRYVTERETPCDYIAMHDVDLLPLNPDLPYDFPEPQSVTHVAAPGLHPKYNYTTFIGGILLVPSNIFESINGMSNVYWGWGLEDDEFFVRLKQSRTKVNRPIGITTGPKLTFRHIHSPKKRPRDHFKCYGQYNKTRRRDWVTGLSNVNYTLQSISTLTIDTAPVTILNVQLHCNFDLSPWCDCSGATNKKPVTGFLTSTSQISQNKLTSKRKNRRN